MVLKLNLIDVRESQLMKESVTCASHTMQKIKEDKIYVLMKCSISEKRLELYSNKNLTGNEYPNDMISCIGKPSSLLLQTIQLIGGFIQKNLHKRHQQIIK